MRFLRFYVILNGRKIFLRSDKRDYCLTIVIDFQKLRMLHVCKIKIGTKKKSKLEKKKKKRLIWSNVSLLVFRICHIRTSTGMKPASSAIGAECPWWTNSLVASWTRSIAATATTPNSPAVAMDVARSSVPVCNLFIIVYLMFQSEKKTTQHITGLC